MNTKQKNILLLSISILVLIVILVGVVYSAFEGSRIVKKFDEYFARKENTIIYFASTTCGACSMQTPVLEDIAKKYNLDFLYVDASKLSNKEIDKVTQKLGIEASTPQTAIVNNGEVLDIAKGYKPGPVLVEFFKSQGILPEDAIYSFNDAPNITIISYEEYEKITKSKDINVVVIGQTGCSHCIAFKPVIDRIASKDKVKVNYLNITDLTQEQAEKFEESLTELEFNDPEFLQTGGYGTPTTLLIKNGKIVDYIVGERSYPKLKEILTDKGVISK